MTVNVSKDELDLFKRNGITPDQISEQVNFYRGKGLSDTSIRSKIDTRLNEFRITGKSTMKDKPYNGVSMSAPSKGSKVYTTLDDRLNNIKNGINNAGLSANNKIGNAISNAGSFLADTGKATWNAFADESILGANAITGTKNWVLDKAGLAHMHKPTEQIKAEREEYFPRFKLNEEAPAANFIGGMLGWAPSFAGVGKVLNTAKIGTTMLKTGQTYKQVKAAQNLQNVAKAKLKALGQLPKEAWYKELFNAANHSGQDMAMFEGGRNLLGQLAGNEQEESLLNSIINGYKIGGLFGGFVKGVPMGIKGLYNANKAAFNYLGNTKAGKAVTGLLNDAGAKLSDSRLADNPWAATITNAINLKAPLGTKLRRYQDISNILSDKSAHDITLDELSKATEGMDEQQAINWFSKMQGKTPEEVTALLKENQKLAERQAYLKKIEDAINNSQPVTRESIGLTNPELPSQEVIDNVQRMNEVVANSPVSISEQVLKGKKELSNEEYKALLNELQNSGKDPLQFVLDNDIKIKAEVDPNQGFESIQVNEPTQIIDSVTPESVKGHVENVESVSEAPQVDGRTKQYVFDETPEVEITSNTPESLKGRVTNYKHPEFDPADDVTLFEKAREYKFDEQPDILANEPKQLKVSVPKIKPNTKKTVAEWRNKYRKSSEAESPVNKIIDSVYSTEELNNLSVEELKSIMSNANKTLKMDATEYRNTYGKPYTKQALRRTKKNLENATNAYSEKYSTDIKRNEVENETGTYGDDWKPVNPNSIKVKKQKDLPKPISFGKVSHNNGMSDVPSGNSNSASLSSALSRSEAKNVYDKNGNWIGKTKTTIIDDSNINTNGFKVTKLEPAKAEGSDWNGNKTSGEEPNYYAGVEKPEPEYTYVEKPKHSNTDTSALETEIKNLKSKAKQAMKEGRIKKYNKIKSQIRQIEQTIKNIKERDSRLDYEPNYEKYMADEGSYSEQAIKSARQEDYNELKDIDYEDIEKRQEFFDKENKGTAFDEHYEKGDYGEAETVGENESSFFNGASDEFKLFWNKYSNAPKAKKSTILRGHIKNMPYKKAQKFRQEVVQQEDFLARKYSPKMIGDETPEGYNYYNEGRTTQSIAEATKSDGATHKEQVYGKGEGKYDRKNTFKRNQENKTIYEYIMKEKATKDVSDEKTENLIFARFNSDWDKAQKFYNSIDSLFPNSRKLLDNAANRFNEMLQGKNPEYSTNTIKLIDRTKPTTINPLEALENANKKGTEGLSEGFKILNKNKELKGTDAGAEHYRMSFNKVLNEDLPKLKIEIGKLKSELKATEDPVRRAEIQYEIDKKSIEMDNIANNYGYRGVNYYQNFNPDNAEMRSYNRNTGKYEGKGVSVDRHSEDLRQTKFDAANKELDEYSLGDDRYNVEQRIKEYEESNKDIEFDNNSVSNLSNKDYERLVTERPDIVRKHLDNLSGENKDKFIASIYNKALTTGKGLAIVRGKSTTVGKIAKSGNKAFQELVDAGLEDVKVSTIPKGQCGIDVDTNEIILSESSIKNNTAPHEIQHIKDNQTIEGHALLIDLANKKVDRYNFIQENKSTIDKAIELIGDKNFKDSSSLYQYLRNKGFSTEIDIIKEYKKLNSQVKNHYMEQRGVKAERGEYVDNIDKELSEMEKTNQIRYRQLQRIIESVESEDSLGGRRQIQRIRNSRRLVSQEGSFTDNFKDAKFNSEGVPEDKEVVSDALGTKYNDTSKFVDDAVNNPENLSKASEDLGLEMRFFTFEQAANRIKQQKGGFYYKKAGKTSKGGTIESGDNLEGIREKEGVYGRKKIEGKPDISKLDAKNTILRTAREYLNRKHTSDVIKTVEDNFAVKIGENGELPKDYVPVNKYALGVAFHEGFGKEWMDAIMKGDDAIDVLYKNSQKGVAESFKDLRKLWTKESDYQYGLPKKVLDFMLDEHGEVSELYKERYLSGDYRGVKGSKVKYHLKRLSEINDIFLDAFKRGVLTSTSFFVNNRFGNQMMLAANSDNPVEYLRSFIEAGKMKSTDIPIELRENVVADAFGGYGKARKITGNEFIDTLAAMTRGEFVDLSTTMKHTIQKGSDRVNYKVLDGLTVPADSKMVKIPTAKTLAVAAGNIAISAPNKVFRAISGAMHSFNNMAENFERKQAMFIKRNKISKDVIKSTGKVAAQAKSIPVMLELCKTNPEFRTATINAVENVLGNYRTFNKIEQQIFKRMIPFYSWYRTMARHEFQLFKQDPVRWGLIHYELAQFKKDNENRVDYQRDALATNITDSHGDRLLINKGGQVPYNTYTELYENLVEGKSTLGGMNPLAIATKEAIQGKHDFLSMEITDRKYARRWNNVQKKYEYVNTKSGKVVGNLPLGARLNYLRRQLIDTTIYPWIRSPYTNPSYYFYGIRDYNKNGKWTTPSKYYDTGYGGYNNGKKYKGGYRKVNTELDEKYKAMNKYLGTTLARERKEEAWRKKYKKK